MGRDQQKGELGHFLYEHIVSLIMIQRRALQGASVKPSFKAVATDCAFRICHDPVLLVIEISLILQAHLSSALICRARQGLPQGSRDCHGEPRPGEQLLSRLVSCSRDFRELSLLTVHRSSRHHQ